jgi:hypothetical protein
VHFPIKCFKVWREKKRMLDALRKKIEGIRCMELLKDQADGMDAAADKMEVLKKKHGPSRARLKSIWLLVLHV